MLSPFFFIVASLSPSPIKIDRGAVTQLKGGLEKVLGTFLNDYSNKWDEIFGRVTKLYEECQRAKNGRLNQQDEDKIKEILRHLEEHNGHAYSMKEFLNGVKEADGRGINRLTRRNDNVRGNPRPDHLRGQSGRVHDLEEDEKQIRENIKELKVDFLGKLKKVSEEWRTFRGPLSQLMQENTMNAQLSNEERIFVEDLDALKVRYETVNGLINELKNDVEEWIREN